MGGSLISIGACAVMILGLSSVAIPLPVTIASCTACLCSLCTAPVVICNQAEMATAGTFRDAINQVREGVNTFADEQGMQMEELNELIAENKRINKALRKVLKGAAIQRIFALLVECDRDGDYKLSGNELNRFAMGLKSIQEDMPIETDELVTKLKEYDNFELTVFLQLIQEMFYDDDDDDDDDNHKDKNDNDDDDDDDDENSVDS